MKNIYMSTAQKKVKPYNELLKEALDGRTNRWLSLKTNIHESEISKIVSGRLIPTEAQDLKIRSAFTFDFTK